MLNDDPKVLVVIPAYNEHGRIGEIVRAVKCILPSAKTLVVNDCSSDDTGNEALDAGAFMVTHPINLGYGAGLETGYLYALRYGYEIVVQMDGDGQHAVSDLDKFVALNSHRITVEVVTPPFIVERVKENHHIIIVVHVIAVAQVRPDLVRFHPEFLSLPN